ncbi:polyketide synthase dehydratase domain-containing protein, partial [Streptomyces sp. NRRL WC-3549]|uniref:polyketide synthase dehydratase domain-containing protein n=1 Tax=Streptomyces sp. NRRL WC-3549 TaxID=1463925 RepID=UPI0004C7BE39
MTRSGARRHGSPTTSGARTSRPGTSPTLCRRAGSRLAVVVDGTAALRAELTAFLAGRPSAVRAAQVTAARTGDLLPLDRSDLHAVATAWLNGNDVDWRGLHQGAARRRVHLPAYPFAGPRHWVAPGERPAEPGSRLHPTLLDANVSTFGEQRFAKTLTGEEFFLRDHVVGGDLVLPGVAYLEMGRLSGELAAGGAPVRGVDDLVWAAPVRLASGHTGHLLLVRVTGDRSRAAFEVRGTAEDAPVHAGGTLRFDIPGPRPAPIALAEVRARCTRVEAAAECYDGFARLGFAYGPAFRVIEEVAEGPGEALATLRLPEPQRAHAGAYTFHPSLLDAALQTAGRLVPGAGEQTGPAPYLPFSLGSVRLYAPLPERGHAYATPARRPAPAGSLAFDVALTDENGQVAATLESFTLRSLRPAGPTRDTDTAPGARAVPAVDVVHAFEPVWEAAPAPHGRLPAAARVLVLEPASADTAAATDVAG